MQPSKPSRITLSGYLTLKFDLQSYEKAFTVARGGVYLSSVTGDVNRPFPHDQHQDPSTTALCVSLKFDLPPSCRGALTLTSVACPGVREMTSQRRRPCTGQSQ